MKVIIAAAILGILASSAQAQEGPCDFHGAGWVWDDAHIRACGESPPSSERDAMLDALSRRQNAYDREAREAATRQREKEAANLTQHPSKKLVEFQKKTDSLFYDMIVATNVYACGLRSEMWVQSFTEGVPTVAALLSQQMGLSNAEDDVANSGHSRAMARARAEYPMDPASYPCRRLAGSKMLRHLDEIQREITGDYH